MSLRRVAAPSEPVRPATITLQPRHWKQGETLPPLTIVPPRRGGWTPARAAKVARAYAREHSLCRAGARAAYLAIGADSGDLSLALAIGARARWQAGPDGDAQIRSMLDPERP